MLGALHGASRPVLGLRFCPLCRYYQYGVVRSHISTVTWVEQDWQFRRDKHGVAEKKQAAVSWCAKTTS